MKADSFFKRLAGIKGIGCMVLALAAGVALLLLNRTGGTETEQPEDRNAIYAKQAEEALEKLGCSLCGVECRAKVRLGGGYVFSYACDQSVRTGYNPDGSVSEKETTLTNRTVNEGNGTALVPVKETPPNIAGVAMVCKGASAADTEALKALIAALYGLDDDAIFVTN